MEKKKLSKKTKKYNKKYLIAGVIALLLLVGFAFNLKHPKKYDYRYSYNFSTPTPTASPTPVDRSWQVLRSYKDSTGITKYIVVIGGSDFINRLYQTTSPNKNRNISFVSNISMSWNKDVPAVSNNSGKKYIYFESFIGDGWTQLIFDENGNIIPMDLSSMGLGTLIKGMYGTGFVKWIGSSTNFIFGAGSGDGSQFEAVFDATTGKQIGETKQTKPASN